MGRIYQTLRDNGVVTLDVNLCKGDWSDQSIYRNTVTVVGTPKWTTGPQGWGMSFGSGSHLFVPNTSTITAPKTLAVVMNKHFQPIPSRVISLRLTTTDIELFLNPTPTQWMLYNGTDSSVIRTSAFSHMVCVPRSGFAATQSGVDTFTPVLETGIANDCYIGGSTRTANLHTPSPIYRAMLLNQPLTQNQAQALLQELQTERYPTRTYSYQKSPQLKLNPTHNAILASNLQDIKGRTATDMSPNNKTGTLVGACFNQANGLYIQGGTNGYVNYGDITQLNNATKATIYVVADPRNDGVSTFAPYVSRGTSDTSRIGIYHGDTTTTVQFSASNGSNGYKQLEGLPNKINHLCLSYDGSRVGAGERVHTYVDGKKVNSTLMAEFPASLPNITADLRLGQFTYSTSLESRNKYKFVGVFAEALNESQVREIYKQFSRVTTYIDIDTVPSTTANITVANSLLPNTPLRLATGQWSIVSNPKAINCVAAGTLYQNDLSSRSVKVSFIWSSGVLQFGLTSVKGAPNATGQNAYWFRVSSGVLSITESVSGTETQLHSGGTIVAGAEYNLHFTWEFDGTLKIWYKQNKSINWALACSTSDTTLGTSSYFCIYSSAVSNKITKEIIGNEICLSPEEWGG